MSGPAELQPASLPTMYFIGVTTGSSAIHRVFGAWKPLLGLDEVDLVGIDIPVGAGADEYRRVAAFLRDDPLSLGALVTTHKLALYDACRTMFAQVNDDARRLGEVSALVTRNGSLDGHALDTITSELALSAFVPSLRGRDALVMGAGGAAQALCDYFAHRAGDLGPERVTVTDVTAERLRSIADHSAGAPTGVTWDLRTIEPGASHDALLAALRPGSLVVNATGMGKDRPGSPLSDSATFPHGASVWDFNYRGELRFLRLAERRAVLDDLTVEDGWRYFVHGWTRAIAVVFELDIPTSGPGFDALAESALAAR